ncbi:hypothetical protein H7142_01290 [Candidatus Saccharibacteria bacterium]|nr:hypothetical protein [Candidatus Saccharibacteria bacterium]
MTTIRENLGHDTVFDDEGDIGIYADFESDYDRQPITNESIIQGTINLAELNTREDEIATFEADMRKSREHALAAKALAESGPHSIIGEHIKTGILLLDAISDMSMYKGGEKGGYKSRNFKKRYEENAPDVESGARHNHQKLVRKTFPELLKASQLIEAGFTEYEVGDMVHETRIKMKRKYGGPKNEKIRNKTRASLKGQ